MYALPAGQTLSHTWHFWLCFACLGRGSWGHRLRSGFWQAKGFLGVTICSCALSGGSYPQPLQVMIRGLLHQRRPCACQAAPIPNLCRYQNSRTSSSTASSTRRKVRAWRSNRLCGFDSWLSFGVALGFGELPLRSLAPVGVLLLAAVRAFACMWAVCSLVRFARPPLDSDCLAA